MNKSNIQILDKKSLNKSKQSAKITGEVLLALKQFIKPGIKTIEIENMVLAEIKERNSKPAFQGYNNYPFATCISVNEDFVHGFPSDRILLEGDIVTVDFGVIFEKMYSDSAYTYPVGQISQKNMDFLDCVWDSLYSSIEQAKPGKKTGDIGFATQEVLLRKGYNPSAELFGHGIGTILHGEPLIPNFGTKGTGETLSSNQCIAIEIMASQGNTKTYTKSDGWTVVTQDHSLTAHYEHTVVVNDPPMILTDCELWSKKPSIIFK
ncbi:type I methionyl aminopeptidase [bacterium]|nr:type I methionyl aminopeptidase [bacterium]|tara:strand:- start:41593 stop:42384 length:792 start_codon:yes stop_codon:yes gene_type:complete